MRKMKTVDAEIAQPQAQTQNQQVFQITKQYTKESSFESPNAPVTLPNDQEHRADVTINVDTRTMGTDSYEVSLHMIAKSVVEGQDIFTVNLVYAGMFTISNIEVEQLNTLLFVICPNILFPFARHILADTVRDGGFPPLMLNPIDFAAIYKQKQQTANQITRTELIQ